MLDVYKRQPLRHPLEVMGTIGEEGTRFGQALIGSQLVEGSWGEPQLDEFRGLEDGLTLRETMKAYGLPGSTTGVCRRDERVKAFIELHDEQGPILENAGISIGVVENIVAISWMHITVHEMCIRDSYRRSPILGVLWRHTVLCNRVCASSSCFRAGSGNAAAKNNEAHNVLSRGILSAHDYRKQHRYFRGMAADVQRRWIA